MRPEVFKLEEAKRGFVRYPGRWVVERSVAWAARFRRLATSSADPLALIAGALPGQTLEIIVQAVNGNLQGVASEPVGFTLPTLTAVDLKRPAAVTGISAPTGYTNGNGNGHARQARTA